jgi:hypothetical protein
MVMSRIPRSCFVPAVVTALALLVVPMAGARPLESSQGVYQTVDGWFTAAVRWVEDLAGIRPAAPARHRRTGSPAIPEKTSSGGSCIDPQGYPRPCPR